ncbi:SDR family NAD(P)-dependent oxidoreductase [Robiginitalea sp. IMCC43444]|uniref:SDR family NAD(P)-dependent oxidoreductase n=1 Tax=Robiginitalea sp. IMCC43444 TaxID=3459121 RepID=UPI0040424975
MNKTIGVMGCGWLGLPLAERLLEKGFMVKGSTTSEDKLQILGEAGIQPFFLKAETSGIEGDLTGFLNGLYCLILNIPPGLRTGPSGSYLSKLSYLIKAFKHAGLPRLIYVSSTAVYGNTQGLITEKVPAIPEDAKGRELLEAEKLLLSLQGTHTQVLRLGGLIGQERHPAYQLSGKKIRSGGNDAINLIHRSDAILAILSLMEQPFEASIFNAVSPEHPRKRDYYATEAIKRGLKPPLYQDTPGPVSGKIINSAIFGAAGIHFSKSLYSDESF